MQGAGASATTGLMCVPLFERTQVLAMVGERREVKALFDELLGPDGMEVRGVSVCRVGVSQSVSPLPMPAVA